MPSVSFTRWRSDRRTALDAVEAAHATVHGTGAGRREALRQISHGYAVLLAAEFHGYCRELHTEAIGHFVAPLPTEQQRIVADMFVFNRQLDRGNATPGSLGSDFGRFGLEWWRVVDTVDTDGPVLRRGLDQHIVAKLNRAQRLRPGQVGRYNSLIAGNRATVAENV